MPSQLTGHQAFTAPAYGFARGRDAIAVAAAPRRDVLGSGSAKRSYDRNRTTGAVSAARSFLDDLGGHR